MNNETFERLINEIREKSIETLLSKNTGYAKGEDRLHNFRAGAEMTGQTLAQTAWGYMTKHLVALRDKVYQDDFSDRDDLMEKCQDIINYVCFIWVCGNEAMEQRTTATAAEENIGEALSLKTYKEMVLENDPHAKADAAAGGVKGCPGNYLYEAAMYNYACIGVANQCEKCWNSPYQGESWRGYKPNHEGTSGT